MKQLTIVAQQRVHVYEKAKYFYPRKIRFKILIILISVVWFAEMKDRKHDQASNPEEKVE